MQPTRKQELASIFENDSNFTEEEFWHSMEMLKGAGQIDRISPATYLFNLLSSPATDEATNLKIRSTLGAAIYSGSNKTLFGENLYLELSSRSASWLMVTNLAKELLMPNIES